MGLGVRGVGFEVWDLGLGVWGLGSGVWRLGLGFRVWGWGLGFGFWGLGFGFWGYPASGDSRRIAGPSFGSTQPAGTAGSAAIPSRQAFMINTR